MDIEEVLSRGAARRIQLPAPMVRRAIREGAGVTQRELAPVIGVTHPTLSRYESGKREPRGANRERYAKALDRLAQEAAARG